MKCIDKQTEPQAFSAWKAMANANWQPSYAELSGKVKESVKEALMQEQGFICCYCERRLTPNDSHIEHFQPQSDTDVDPLDYANLLCSCQQQLEKGEPRHCGNLKGDWFDKELLISPLAPSCANRFAFTGNGDIKPQNTDDDAAVMTIDKLGLDIPKLKALRRNAIEPFLDENLTREELGVFVKGYLGKDASGKFGEFWSTVHHLFGGFAEA